MKMKKLVALVLVCLLAALLPLSVAADAWIPPDEKVNMYLLSAVHDNDYCTALNAFVSNYAEANMSAYTTGDSDDGPIRVVLKHLELNAHLFGEDVTSFQGEDGKTYMEISEERFENRMWKLFRRNIPAKDCPGYEDGVIRVSAESFGKPILVFATVYYCGYAGDGLYDVSFSVYHNPNGVTNEYRYCYMDAPGLGYATIGTGSARFRFEDPDQTNFTSSDFQLVSFSMEANGIPCTNENLPYVAQGNQAADRPTGPVEVPTEASTEPAAEVTETPVRPTETEPEETKPVTQETERPVGGGSRVLVIVVVALVIVAALLSLVVILLLYKLKQK